MPAIEESEVIVTKDVAHDDQRSGYRAIFTAVRGNEGLGYNIMVVQPVNGFARVQIPLKEAELTPGAAYALARVMAEAALHAKERNGT